MTNQLYRVNVYAKRKDKLMDHFSTVEYYHHTKLYKAISSPLTKNEAYDMLRLWKRSGYTVTLTEYESYHDNLTRGRQRA